MKKFYATNLRTRFGPSHRRLVVVLSTNRTSLILCIVCCWMIIQQEHNHQQHYQCWSSNNIDKERQQQQQKYGSFSFMVVATTSSTGSNSNSYRYNPYQYDMTTPQFTPDGRLLQVEYATVAAIHRSNSIVIIPITNDLTLIGTIRSSIQSSSRKKKEQQQQHHIVQERLLVVPTSTNKNNNGDDNNGGIVIGLSGVVADSLALLQYVNDEIMRSIRYYGIHQKQITAFQIADIVATRCQQHSFGGGIRPFGSSFLILSYEQDRSQKFGVPMNDNNNSKSILKIYKTDPSGACQIIPINCNNDDDDDESIIYVSGGGNIGSQLYRKLQSEWKQYRTRIKSEQLPSSTTSSNKNEQQSQLETTENPKQNLDTAILANENNNELERSAIQLIISIMVTEYWKQQQQQQQQQSNDDDNKPNEQIIPLMEVILMSSSRGIIKLSQQSIQELFLLRQTKL